MKTNKYFNFTYEPDIDGEPVYFVKFKGKPKLYDFGEWYKMEYKDWLSLKALEEMEKNLKFSLWFINTHFNINLNDHPTVYLKDAWLSEKEVEELYKLGIIERKEVR